MVRFYVIQDLGGQEVRHDFATEGKLIAGLAAMGARLAGLQAGGAGAHQVAGRPRFDGAAGPEWDAGAIRYTVQAARGAARAGEGAR